MTLDEDVRTVLKNELEASEVLSDITRGNEWDEIDRAFIEEASTIINNIDDPQRTKTVLIIVMKIGQSIESEKLIAFSRKNLEDWKAKYE